MVFLGIFLVGIVGAAILGLINRVVVNAVFKTDPEMVRVIEDPSITDHAVKFQLLRAIALKNRSPFYIEDLLDLVHRGYKPDPNGPFNPLWNLEALAMSVEERRAFDSAFVGFHKVLPRAEGAADSLARTETAEGLIFDSRSNTNLLTTKRMLIVTVVLIVVFGIYRFVTPDPEKVEGFDPTAALMAEDTKVVEGFLSAKEAGSVQELIFLPDGESRPSLHIQPPGEDPNLFLAPNADVRAMEKDPPVSAYGLYRHEGNSVTMHVFYGYKETISERELVFILKDGKITRIGEEPRT